MQDNIRNTEASIIESDKSHRPDSYTRVAYAERSVGDATCAKGSNTIPGTLMTKTLHAKIVRKVQVTIPTIGSV